MAAAVTTQLWSLTDMVRVIEAWEAHRAAKFADRLGPVSLCEFVLEKVSLILAFEGDLKPDATF